MAIGTPVLREAVGTASTSATTASFTPTANSKLFAWICGSATGGVPSEPTVSDSLGLTWTRVGAISLDGGSGDLNSVLFYTEIGASPSAMTVTGTSGSAARMAVVTFDVTGVGTDFSNIITGTNLNGDPSLTIPNAFSSGGAGFGFVSAVGNNNFTPPSGYTELYDASPGTSLTRRQTIVYDLTSPGSTLTWSSTNVDAVALAVEFKEPVAGGDGVGSATGSGTASGTGASTFAAAGASSGASTDTAVGSSIAEAAASSVGAATVTATGGSIGAADAAAGGIAAASAAGTSIVPADAASTGSAAADAVGRAVADIIATALGTSTATAFTDSPSVAEATGTAVVSGAGASLADAAASATGTSTAAAEGFSAGIQSAVGNAAGTCTVLGVNVPVVAPERILFVAAEVRLVNVATQSRGLTVPSENRTLEVIGDE